MAAFFEGEQIPSVSRRRHSALPETIAEGYARACSMQAEANSVYEFKDLFENFDSSRAQNTQNTCINEADRTSSMNCNVVSGNGMEIPFSGLLNIGACGGDLGRDDSVFNNQMGSQRSGFGDFGTDRRLAMAASNENLSSVATRGARRGTVSGCIGFDFNRREGFNAKVNPNINETLFQKQNDGLGYNRQAQLFENHHDANGYPLRTSLSIRSSGAQFSGLHQFSGLNMNNNFGIENSSNDTISSTFTNHNKRNNNQQINSIGNNNNINKNGSSQGSSVNGDYMNSRTNSHHSMNNLSPNSNWMNGSNIVNCNNTQSNHSAKVDPEMKSTGVGLDRFSPPLIDSKSLEAGLGVTDEQMEMYVSEARKIKEQQQQQQQLDKIAAARTMSRESQQHSNQGDFDCYNSGGLLNGMDKQIPAKQEVVGGPSAAYLNRRRHSAAPVLLSGNLVNVPSRSNGLDLYSVNESSGLNTLQQQLLFNSQHHERAQNFDNYQGDGVQGTSNRLSWNGVNMGGSGQQGNNFNTNRNENLSVVDTLAWLEASEGLDSASSAAADISRLHLSYDNMNGAFGGSLSYYSDGMSNANVRSASPAGDFMGHTSGNYMPTQRHGDEGMSPTDSLPSGMSASRRMSLPYIKYAIDVLHI
ncbi:hypothetical protein SARC_04892 [Sphaeroforma arctica JP610]|uniref:Uncharacterized protein n=1 Tax=Sphaeroforma arctica JP610 TaxID=667725 RepID=A0A0L0G1W5_9EUKA|nr:hypothetical protein SARC_04892 [Sphaeroforma arctica JP610]KNC82826.1 hypothetical protein SARC_04892 [Sphaeroforma arctica JP610]|eukprot:XP_014156728.1 hypothetical protein SARC_04892 [Sphaeroforma arctica JP610]